MGISGDNSTVPLLQTGEPGQNKIPKDSFRFAYIVYFTLGAGFLLPWNAFITAVDYFNYIYPNQSVDRSFAVVYMMMALFSLLLIVFWARKSDAYVRINVGIALFIVSISVVPVMDVSYVKGQSGLYDGLYVTIAAVAIAGMGDALVQGGVIGSAGELPERYMQALCAGTAGSGVLVSFLRIFTKAVYTQDVHGLRNSALLYFIVGILLMIICLVFYNLAHHLPIIKYYNQLKIQALKEEKQEKGSLSGPVLEIMSNIKWHATGIVFIYIVTLSIFPGFITEDVHSAVLGDWYAILLITSFNVFDFIGKCLTAVYLPDNANVAVAASFARLLFYPLYLGCLHGPQFFRTEVPVVLLTCLLGLTNGYWTSVLMILAPKTVQLQNAETAGILITLFLIIGLALGSIVSWFWVI